MSDDSGINNSNMYALYNNVFIFCINITNLIFAQSFITVHRNFPCNF